MPWYYDPHSGGIKIPPTKHWMISAKVEAYMKTRPWYPKITLRTRFRGQLCYVDSIEDGKPCPLARLRHFTMDSWSLGFFAYSNERYQPCLINGKDMGSIEDAIAECEIYLS